MLSLIEYAPYLAGIVLFLIIVMKAISYGRNLEKAKTAKKDALYRLTVKELAKKTQAMTDNELDIWFKEHWHE